MINPLDECFAKSKNMVEEITRKIERKIDEDYASNCYLPETNELAALCFSGHPIKSKNVDVEKEKISMTGEVLKCHVEDK